LSYLDEVNKKRQQAAQDKQSSADKQAAMGAITGSGQSVADAVHEEGAKARASTQKVDVQNADLAKKDDVQQVVDSINKLNITTFVANKDSWTNVVETMAGLTERIQSVMQGLESGYLDKIDSSFTTAIANLQDTVASMRSIEVKSDKDIAAGLKQLSKTLSSLDLKPTVNVPQPKVTVNEREIDLSPLETLLEGIKQQLADNRVELPTLDFSSLENAVNGVKSAVNGLSFPVPNYVLPFKDIDGKAIQVQLDADGNLPISASLSGADGAITDGASSSVKATVFDLSNSNPLAAQIVDASGDAITSFGGGTQYTEGDIDASITGTAMMWEDGSNTLRAVSAAKPLPVDLGANNDITLATLPDTSGGDLASIASDSNTIAGAVSGTEMQVDVLTLPDATAVGKAADGAAVSGNPVRVAGSDGTNTRSILTDNGGRIILGAGANAIGKLAANSGVDIGDVDVTSLPTDPFGANADAASATGSISAKLRFIASTGIPITGTVTVGSHAVTNAGTFAVQDSTTQTNTGNAATSLGIMDDWDNGASDGASVSGDVAHDSADAGEPVKIGAKAYSPDGTTPGTAVAENDRTNLKTDLDGSLFVRTTPATRGHKHLDGSTAYTDESIVADPGDGFQVVITNIIASTGAATALNFFLEEGSTKVFGPIYLEAVAGRGFASGPIHLPITASTAVTLTSSASIAQSFDIDYFIQAV